MLQAPTYYRKIIKIKAADSPNVKRGLHLKANGYRPDSVEVLPGVLTWAEYQERMQTWDDIRRTIGLEAEFYEGKEVMLYPPEWLTRAEHRHRELQSIEFRRGRVGKAIGIDPGEGGAESSICVVDDYGILELVAERTPNTAVISNNLIALGRKWQVPSSHWMFDRGGGGKQLADRLIADGYEDVQTVGFGETITPDINPTGLIVSTEERVDQRAERYVFKNRRAQMYGILREMLDPSSVIYPKGFGIPAEYVELRRQLAPLPLWYDEEGRMYLPPKQRKTGERKQNTTIITIQDLIGCSPDQADSLVTALYCMVSTPQVVEAWGA